MDKTLSVSTTADQTVPRVHNVALDPVLFCSRRHRKWEIILWPFNWQSL